jgi:hypothetical protein
MRKHDGDDSRVTLGFRSHSGWAAMVALRGPAAAPLVIQRRRLELIDPRISGAKQPYHAAAEMPLKDAEAFLGECAEVADAMAYKAVQQSVADLKSKGLNVAGCCVLLASGRQSCSLAATLASHAAIHTAEGDFFRNALQKACAGLGLTSSPFKEKEVWDRATIGLGMSRGELEGRIAELGKSIGPPWRQDEKFCALAAWLLLA